MVTVGEISVRLVEAKTKTPFKEHTSGSEVYAEVEPKEEYFVEIKHITTGNDRKVFSIEVDGHDLNYDTWEVKKPSYHGLFTRDESGNETERAMLFQKPRLSQELGKPVVSFGKVTVKIFEAVSDGYEILGAMKSSLPSPSVSSIADLQNKAVRSGEGSTTICSDCGSQDKPVKVVKAGKFLNKVEINYCTTVV